jgi:hypothetical protein
MKSMAWSNQNFLDVVAHSGLSAPERSVPVVASGVVAFGTTLAASTLAQKLVGLSTGSLRPLPTVALFVDQLSSASHRRRGARRPVSWDHLVKAWPQDTSRTVVSLGNIRVTAQMVRVCLVGLLAYRVALGGRFWAVAPSSYTHLGSFARGSLPATARYAAPSQRQQIEKMGRLLGCHTCGSRRLLQRVDAHQFVGDHMPPKSVADQMNRAAWRRILHRKVSFRFYPQCIVCSSKQGSLLSAAAQHNSNNKYSPFRIVQLAGVGGGHQAHFHGWRPRLSHLAGGVVAAAALIDPDLATIELWSRRAGYKVQSFVQRALHRT